MRVTREMLMELIFDIAADGVRNASILTLILGICSVIALLQGWMHNIEAVYIWLIAIPVVIGVLTLREMNTALYILFTDDKFTYKD